MGQPVTRNVDSIGGVSFAGVNYRVGNPYRRQQVEVRVVGDTVEISEDGKLLPGPPGETRPDQSPRSLRQPRRQTQPDQRRQLNPRPRVVKQPEPAGRPDTET